MPYILASLRRFLGHGAYKEESRPPHKYHPRLVLLCMPSSTVKLSRVIQFPYDFGCGKIETQYRDVNKIRIARRWRLVIQAGVLLINAIFCDEKMRWEVGRDKVVNGCRLSGVSMDDNKWDHVIRSRDHDITIASLLGASFVECVIHQRRWYLFSGRDEKTSCLLDKKMRKKNQIPEYHAYIPEGYDKEDTRLIDEKPPNPVRVLRKKTKRSMKCDWWKTS